MDNQSSDKKINRGVSSGLVLVAVNIIVALAQVRLAIEFLPKGLAGTWFLFLSLAVYIGFFDLGISPTISREISFIIGYGDWGKEKQNREIADLIATCFRLFEVLALTIFVVGLLSGAVFLSLITEPGSFKTVTVAWVIFTAGAAVNLLGGAAFAALYGLGYIATERIVRSVTLMLGLGLMALFLYMGFGIIGLAAAWSFQGLLARLIAWIALNRYYPDLRTVRGRARMAIIKKIAVPSLKWAGTGLGAILTLQTDNLVISIMIGPSAIPPYEAVAKIVTTVMMLSLLIVTSSTPFLSKAHAAGDSAEFKKITLMNVRRSLSVMILLLSFFAIFGDRVVNVWLGPGNFVGFPVLIPLFVMALLEIHHVSLAVAVMSTGNIAFVWTALCAGVINLMVSFVLAKYLGLFGVALGTLIAQLLTNNWYVPYVALNMLKVTRAHYFKSVLFPNIAALCTLIAVDLLIRELTSSYSDIATFVLALSASALAGALILFFDKIFRGRYA